MELYNLDLRVTDQLLSEVFKEGPLTFTQFLLNRYHHIHSSVERGDYVRVADQVLESFTWDRTYQGSRYWSELNRKINARRDQGVDILLGG